DFDVLRNLPDTLRKADWDATAVIWKNQIIAIEPGDTSGRCFGLAVDVGTTKIAGFLIDLTSGVVVGVAARMNSQIPFGEDIMSRVTHVMMGMGCCQRAPGSRDIGYQRDHRGVL
ncbi:MAG: hypothetical protein ACERKS_10305, partial [Candidatus Bathyarchaeota archaeon]